MKKTILTLAVAVSFTVPAFADTITLWNFNGASATTVPGGENSPTAATGSGTASLFGGTTAAASFGSASANGGSSDPVATTPEDYGWQTTSYPGAGSATVAGVMFTVDTSGYNDIILSYDVRHSNTSSRYERVEYTLNGTDWIISGFSTGAAGDTWFNQRTIDLSSVSGADNNSLFAFRISAAWESDATGSGTGDYVASNTGSTYAGTGTWRFDMVTVSGTVTAIPEPATGAVAGLGLAALLVFRRRTT